MVCPIKARLKQGLKPCPEAAQTSVSQGTLAGVWSSLALAKEFPKKKWNKSNDIPSSDHDDEPPTAVANDRRACKSLSCMFVGASGSQELYDAFQGARVQVCRGIVGMLSTEPLTI